MFWAAAGAPSRGNSQGRGAEQSGAEHGPAVDHRRLPNCDCCFALTLENALCPGNWPPGQGFRRGRERPIYGPAHVTPWPTERGACRCRFRPPRRPDRHSPPAALSVAQGAGRGAAAGGRGRAAADRRQGDHRLHPDHLQARGRRPERAGGRHRPAARAAAGLRRRAHPGGGLRGAARDGLRAGGAERDPCRGAGDVPAPAPAVAALPSGAADRRPVAGDRARHQRHRQPAPLPAVPDRPDAVRDRAGRGRAVAALRRALRRHHPRHHRRLRRLYAGGHAVADQVPPPDGRGGERGQHQGDRQPAQLRDGQVFRQRGARGAALRPRARRLREGRDQERQLAVAAQCRAGADHRRRRHADHDPGRARAWSKAA